MAYVIWFAYCLLSGMAAGGTHNITVCIIVIALNALVSTWAISWLKSILD